MNSASTGIYISKKQKQMVQQRREQKKAGIAPVEESKDEGYYSCESLSENELNEQLDDPQDLNRAPRTRGAG
jgi:DNA-binding protein H-NS